MTLPASTAPTATALTPVPPSDWLSAALLFLAVAVLIVPLAKRLGLGAILGYLIAGLLIGPWGLGFVRDPEAILHGAEFGVVLMLFLVGLELEPRRLWAMRCAVFGWGSLQLLGSTALLAAAGALLGLPWAVSLVGALALAMSSTAIGLGTLAERSLMGSAMGAMVLAVLLLQDIAAIPILAGVPLLGDSRGGGNAGLAAAQALGVVALLVGGGHWLLRPALRWIARSRLPELFTAAALLLVVGAAALMRLADLSMALGAFLAGVLLAGSEYRKQLETDLEPFKGLLLGLFFMAVGMSIDFGVLAAAPGQMAALLLGLLTLKAVLLVGMARGLRLAAAERPYFVLLLAQGGEFGFVVAQTGQSAGVLSSAQASMLLGAIALSMFVTPLLLGALERWWLPRLAACDREGRPLPPRLDEAQEQEAPVILAGFGRYGQIVGRVLSAQGRKATVLDNDPEQVASVRRFGWEAYYGDATRLDLLRAAGAARAQVLVIALDDGAASEALARLAREQFPHLQIVARARNVTHYHLLRRAGVQHVERETFESALVSSRQVLELLGLSSPEAQALAQAFRAHNIEQLEAMLPHFGNEAQLIALSKQGREQLEALWAAQRAAQAPHPAGASVAPPSAHNQEAP
ncbi:glutathione-regulated potassium-efflux system protein KefC [Inhella gelatinilytica]|uniref:Glutathione-regulated potassium-efflux system protein KefC n=1 Tax=Inhella gelatinilytica TaxID=2795030 RepID=A0A931ISQ1_9BURK|nr:glutathione-regulated potassium-efflux system protein KefC [Inhella gelatinilytica]MBH9551439.1 glutathione-regulated potassium-efflux system protein KefC [Inhella gelatinilytica]